jgi:hypothetical protein
MDRVDAVLDVPRRHRTLAMDAVPAGSLALAVVLTARGDVVLQPTTRARGVEASAIIAIARGSGR